MKGGEFLWTMGLGERRMKGGEFSRERRYAVYAGSAQMGQEDLDHVGLADVAAWLSCFLARRRCAEDGAGWPPPPLADEDAPSLADRLQAWFSDLFWCGASDALTVTLDPSSI